MKSDDNGVDCIIDTEKKKINLFFYKYDYCVELSYKDNASIDKVINHLHSHIDEYTEVIKDLSEQRKKIENVSLSLISRLTKKAICKLKCHEIIRKSVKYKSVFDMLYKITQTERNRNAQNN